MKRDEHDGQPLVVRTKRGLGVRLDDDIFPDEDGMVDPDSGGMSVSHAPEHLPSHRRSPEFGGDGPDPLWEMDEDDLPDGLICRADSETHAMIEPAWRMETRDYEELLADTRDLWQESEPELG